jgi:hypothetical protein
MTNLGHIGHKGTVQCGSFLSQSVDIMQPLSYSQDLQKKCQEIKFIKGNSCIKTCIPYMRYVNAQIYPTEEFFIITHYRYEAQ